MPEPFKNVYNSAMIAQIGEHIRNQHRGFDSQHFVARATDGLEELELKQRSNQILSALEETLPSDFIKATNHMLSALHPEDSAAVSGQTMDTRGIRGWAVMPMADYVARHGLEHFDFSMEALRQMTKRSSSEFAVRPFIAREPERAMRHVATWCDDDNYHVRRLASEGTRPRLPWGMRLSVFIENPKPLLPVLEALRDDTEDYVRRSVANSLNDIAKDHPDLVANIARDWLAGSSDKTRSRLVRHGCRTLIKSGHRQTLEVLGFRTPCITLKRLSFDTDRLMFGESLTVSAELLSDSDVEQDLVIDYVVHHQKANGTTSPKVFKWKTVRLPARANLTLTKRHAFKPITTRTYHSGNHTIELQVNGQSVGQSSFDLIV